MHRWTAICFVTIRISIFEWDIAVLQDNKIFFIKNQKLLYQHSEITVLISLITPHPSTSLFLATGPRPCLVSLRMPPITYFSRWRHERMRSSYKLSVDTVLRAQSKNTQFFVKVYSSDVSYRVSYRGTCIEICIYCTLRTCIVLITSLLIKIYLQSPNGYK